ncbi:ABC transporter ATP-binding protein [Paraburkholderia terricola]|uniref:Peptide/nickel transport system ATP-binding protein n=1 Tax=Paraburkholderia terricola TaxID=169427 RepID=A0A1M6M3B5_9BURK|nr:MULTISPECIES: ABC transporter ATP-binding protein [Paraburkholderia]SDN94483.1 peptide/nickel transport system ATP-binding protein [Paraburkholderia sediminicola]SHJ77906.1 peptide/nickel transport system ATP-binding protein [Paraburkholderia terricola]
MIDVQQAQIRFKTKTGYFDAVKDASFQVGEGEVFGLVGESGSGKSTVLRALSGLTPLAGGGMRVGRHVLGEKIDRSFRRDVQMVFQDPYASLHPRFTVDQTLREPLAINGIDRQEERIVQALLEVGLGPAFRFRYPHQLSGGQRQRVAIARALIVEPRVLLLDEPTSALDVSVQTEILNLLRRLHRERRPTMVLVSHNLAVVGFLCQRVAVMRNGEIVEERAIEQIRAQQVEHDYTRSLLLATDGYRRQAVEVIGVDAAL